MRSTLSLGIFAALTVGVVAAPSMAPDCNGERGSLTRACPAETGPHPLLALGPGDQIVRKGTVA